MLKNQLKEINLVPSFPSIFFLFHNTSYKNASTEQGSWCNWTGKWR